MLASLEHLINPIKLLEKLAGRWLKYAQLAKGWKLTSKEVTEPCSFGPMDGTSSQDLFVGKGCSVLTPQKRRSLGWLQMASGHPREHRRAAELKLMRFGAILGSKKTNGRPLRA